jgi:hypothetical protein
MGACGRSRSTRANRIPSRMIRPSCPQDHPQRPLRVPLGERGSRPCGTRRGVPHSGAWPHTWQGAVQAGSQAPRPSGSVRPRSPSAPHSTNRPYATPLPCRSPSRRARCGALVDRRHPVDRAPGPGVGCRAQCRPHRGHRRASHAAWDPRGRGTRAGLGPRTASPGTCGRRHLRAGHGAVWRSNRGRTGRRGRFVPPGGADVPCLGRTTGTRSLHPALRSRSHAW